MDERREPLPAEGGRPDRPKHRGLRRFLIFLAVLAAVLGVVALAAWRDGTGFDALRRYFAYGAGSGSGTIRYEASTANRFAALDGGVAILSDRELTVCKDDGTEVCRLSLSLGSPALAECRGRAVAYDVGGTELYVVDISGKKFHLSLDGAITAASLNGGGYLAVTAEAPNCKSAVSVYDPSGTEIFLFKSAQRFLSTASVTEDGKTLAAVALGQEGGVFTSSILLYDLTKDAQEPQETVAIPDDLVFTLGATGTSLAALGQDGLSFLPLAGESKRYDFAGQYLRGYHFGGEGFTLLQLNRYQSGSAGKLVTVDADGQVLGELELREEVLDLSAAGRYAAVLYTDRCVIYSSALQEYASLVGTDGIRAVLQRTDGSALLLGAEEARLFVP